MECSLLAAQNIFSSSFLPGYVKILRFTEVHFAFFKWFIPVVCDYNIKYQKISGGWVKTQHFITVQGVTG